jgi:hypothetical protein
MCSEHHTNCTIIYRQIINGTGNDLYSKARNLALITAFMTSELSSQHQHVNSVAVVLKQAQLLQLKHVNHNKIHCYPSWNVATKEVYVTKTRPYGKGMFPKLLPRILRVLTRQYDLSLYQYYTDCLTIQ